MRILKAFGVSLALSACATAQFAFLRAAFISRLGGPEGGIQGRHTVEGRQAPVIDTTPMEIGLAPRQAGNNNGQNRGGGDSCECRTKCPSKHFVIDTKNCARCVRCPNNKVADPKSQWKRCVPDRGQHDNDTKSRRNEKEKKWPEKKKQMTKKYKDGGDDRKDKNNKRKIKRTSMCVPIAVMGVEIGILAEKYMDGFFSEEYLESTDVLQYWPDELTIDEWELDTWDDSQEEEFYQGAYLDSWVEYAAENWGGGNSDKRGIDRSDAPVAGRNRLRDLEKRQRFPGVGFVRGVISGIAEAAGKRLGEQWRTKIDGFFKGRGRPALGKGKSKKEQGEAIKLLRDQGPLKWCLRRETPRNHS